MHHSWKQVPHKLLLDRTRNAEEIVKELWYFISKSTDAQGRFRPRQIIQRDEGWYGLISLRRVQNERPRVIDTEGVIDLERADIGANMAHISPLQLY